MAFVCILIGLTITFPGALGNSILAAFNNVSGQLSLLISNAS